MRRLSAMESEDIDGEAVAFLVERVQEITSAEWRAATLKNCFGFFFKEQIRDPHPQMHSLTRKDGSDRDFADDGDFTADSDTEDLIDSLPYSETVRELYLRFGDPSRFKQVMGKREYRNWYDGTREAVAKALRKQGVEVAE